MRRTATARRQDALLALSLLTGSLLALGRAPDSVPRVSVFLVQLVVAVAWLRRDAARATGGRIACSFSAPAVLSGGVAFLVAAPWPDWPLAATTLFALGAVWTAGALWALGRSFAVFPARRRIVTRGPYRWLRHPAYAGQLLMVVACAATRNGWVRWGLVAAACAAVVLRIVAEERFLRRSDDYAQYAGGVRFRLVPFVW